MKALKRLFPFFPKGKEKSEYLLFCSDVEVEVGYLQLTLLLFYNAATYNFSNEKGLPSGANPIQLFKSKNTELQSVCEHEHS